MTGKVPLTMDKDNVPPSFRHKLYVHTLNHEYALLRGEKLKAPWVHEALTKASSEALRYVVEGIYGKDPVITDPSNPEATKLAYDRQVGVIPSRALTKEILARVKNEHIAEPAGRRFPSGVPTSPDGEPPIEPDDWTPAMNELAAYARTVGKYLLGFEPDVEFANIVHFGGGHRDALAWWGGGAITFNLGRLGKKWPANASQEEVDELLIHEFAHEKATDHLSEAFYNACCRLGARLRSYEERLRQAA